ncbi:MAG: hypothetical protein HY055_06160 [Magnetospirillum sp.]|nr:hypothetical protein [Magnetospirillum sp.]
MKTHWPALFLVSLLAAAPALAGEGRDHDHDRARRSVLAGEILPLSRILEQVDRDFPGELIEAELESHHGRQVYEIKRLTKDGRVLKLRYDAVDGTRLKHGERDRDREAERP